MHTIAALGAAFVAAGLLARGGRLIALPTIPAFMAAGILLGPSLTGVIGHPEDLELVADLGLIVLLFALGVDFPVEAVLESGRRLVGAAFAFIAINVTGGLLLGFALGWGTSEALVIAGAVGISSSAIVTKLLVELRRLTNAETPIVLGIIVVEDLFLAIYLALLLIARYAARWVGALLDTDSDELTTILAVGLAVLVAGLAEEVEVSEAIGALMIGLVISRTVVAERVERVIAPVRDAFAAIFFVVFGASIELGALGGVAVAAAAAVALTLVTNTVGGMVVARIHGLNQRSAANAALVLLGRGEFSLILATLAIAAGLDGRIGPFVALYVLVLALIGPILAARSGGLSRALPARVLSGGYQYVGYETMVQGCEHLDRRPHAPESDGCEDCRALGDEWTHLRTCLECGYVGCCDDSKNTHATKHHRATGHPAIASLEPDEDWRYCYVDEVLAAGSGLDLAPDPDDR